MTTSTRKTHRETLSDLSAPTNIMIPVDYASIPSDFKRGYYAPRDGSWTEMFAPLATDEQGGCKHGCKVYGRRRGCVVEFAVLHSTSYGHFPRKTDADVTHGHALHDGTAATCESCHREHFGWDVVESSAT